MNILILSASTGGGHMAASKAIEQYMINKEKDAKIKTIDTFEYISPTLNKVIDNGYLFLYTKIPEVYGKLYNSVNKESKRLSLLKKFNYALSKKLLKLIGDFKADIIIATHPFSAEMASNLKDKNLIQLPILCIMTDYAPHKTWINENIDAYVVSSDYMKDQMVTLGVNKDIIFPFGIPISETFFKPSNKIEFLTKLGLDPCKTTLLLMAGSLGVTRLLDIYNELSKVDLDFQMLVITGKDKDLYNKFYKVISYSNKSTKLTYYTQEVHNYMKSADILVTKPGGLTVSEAIACNIPMVLYNAIPGQEYENAEFLTKNNMATIFNSVDFSSTFKELIQNKEKLSKMKLSCESFSKYDSLVNIQSLINKLLAS